MKLSTANQIIEHQVPNEIFSMNNIENYSIINDNEETLDSFFNDNGTFY